MKSSQTISWPRAAMFSLSLAAMTAVGCQSSISGQTSPSAYYPNDDVQFHRAGSEDRLPNKRLAFEEYRLKQQNNANGLNDAPAGR